MNKYHKIISEEGIEGLGLKNALGLGGKIAGAMGMKAIGMKQHISYMRSHRPESGTGLPTTSSFLSIPVQMKSRHRRFFSGNMNPGGTGISGHVGNVRARKSS
jgi:hypothetical protein